MGPARGGVGPVSRIPGGAAIGPVGGSEAGARHVRLTFTRNRDAARRVLHDRALVLRTEDHGASAEVELAPGADGERLLRALVGADVGLSQFAVVEPSLESIFIARVGPAAATAVAEVTDA